MCGCCLEVDASLQATTSLVRCPSINSPYIQIRFLLFEDAHQLNQLKCSHIKFDAGVIIDPIAFLTLIHPITLKRVKMSTRTKREKSPDVDAIEEDEAQYGGPLTLQELDEQ
jgi:hypothetical protein